MLFAPGARAPRTGILKARSRLFPATSNRHAAVLIVPAARVAAATIKTEDAGSAGQ